MTTHRFPWPSRISHTVDSLMWWALGNRCRGIGLALGESKYPVLAWVHARQDVVQATEEIGGMEDRMRIKLPCWQSCATCGISPLSARRRINSYAAPSIPKTRSLCFARAMRGRSLPEACRGCARKLPSLGLVEMQV